MARLLAVNSSPISRNSVSRYLLANFVQKYRSEYPEDEIIERDVGTNPPPHLSELLIGTYFLAAEDHNEYQRLALQLSDELVDEFLGSDIVVIGSPMHNFGVTSGLKAYIDHIVRVGRTFRYGADGPVGLASGKKMVVITSRGSDYSAGSPLQAMEHQESYLRSIFTFIGVSDVVFLHCQGTALSPDSRQVAMDLTASQIHPAIVALAR
jgi:FMN-dependent NADH-azoreductase